jgi:small-conductance mechanosensitive channel
VSLPEVVGLVPDWILGLAGGAATSAALWIGLRFLTRRLRRFAGRTATGADDLVADMVARTQWWFVLWAGVVVGLAVVSLPPRFDQAVRVMTVLAIGLQAGLWATTLVLGAVALLGQGKSRLESASGSALILVIGARLAVWSLVTVLVLANLGIDITALVAGLGIGGVAVALAVQAILGDLFASLSIVLDKPFAVGHFIVVGDLMGTVERIGLKTTRLRSLWGEQLVIANSKLLESRIRNYRLMEERRIAFEFGVTYQTPPEVLRAIPREVREIVTARDGIRFDRAHFKAFGDSALLFEVVYWILDPDYNRYMDTQQEINLALFERLPDLGADFAYPTQTVLLARANQAPRVSAVGAR